MGAPAADETLVATLRAAGCVYAEDEAQALLAAAGDTDELRRMVAARIGGLPLEQVVGHAEFCGIRVAVAPGVFVPRLRSSLLVRRAALRLGAGDVVLDLCCGSGAIGAALRAVVPGVEVYAADLDPAAAACARRNLPAERVFEGDLYDPLPTGLRGRVAVIVANAPYVPTDAIETMPAEAREHEHRLALDGGPDGLDVQRRVVSDAPGWLAPGGRVLVETSGRQADGSAAMMTAAGLCAEVHTDPDVDGVLVEGRISAARGW